MPDPMTVPSGTSIEIETRPARYATFDAAVILRGEHDMASAGSIDDALGSVAGDILVDFSQCTFCDSSVVRVLFDASCSRRLEGRRIELLVPDGNAIARIFQITGLGSRVTIHHGPGTVSADGPRAAPTQEALTL
jgi:anti-anti-sigma factor